MVDFMANIKNKKSMKKYNVKTLAEIAVLCIFCDNIQVWSMNGQEVMNPKLQEVMNPNPKENSPIPIKKRLGSILFDSMNFNGQVDLNLRSERLDTKDYLNGSNENCGMKNFSENTKIYKKKLWGTKNENYENKLELLFFNNKGHLSLCCCINFFNGNMKKTYLRKLRKIGKNKRTISSECSEYAESSQKDNSNDENNYEPRPDNNNNTITLNGNINLPGENNNGKNYTNDGPGSSYPQKIINNTTNSNPFKDE